MINSRIDSDRMRFGLCLLIQMVGLIVASPGNAVGLNDKQKGVLQTASAEGRYPVRILRNEYDQTIVILGETHLVTPQRLESGLAVTREFSLIGLEGPFLDSQRNLVQEVLDGISRPRTSAVERLYSPSAWQEALLEAYEVERIRNPRLGGERSPLRVLSDELSAKLRSSQDFSVLYKFLGLYDAGRLTYPILMDESYARWLNPSAGDELPLTVDERNVEYIIGEMRHLIQRSGPKEFVSLEEFHSLTPATIDFFRQFGGEKRKAILAGTSFFSSVSIFAASAIAQRGWPSRSASVASALALLPWFYISFIENPRLRRIFYESIRERNDLMAQSIDREFNRRRGGSGDVTMLVIVGELHLSGLCQQLQSFGWTNQRVTSSSE